MPLFENAVRNKFRFNSTKGSLTVEDLWDLPLTSTKGSSLDSIAKLINKDLKSEEEESFVNPSSNSKAKLLQNKLDIVKRVIQVKQEENEASRKLVEKRNQREKLLQIREMKEHQELTSMSLEEIDQLISDLS